ncbi:MAG: Gfo/Idh/MocA family oxidoreductase [Caldilineaceae bacterium]|nr:Gfo/Idh/MocA family oxidoreductase [Caldilineaceae bacterium]
MDKPVYRVAVIGLGRMGSTIDDELAPGSPAYSVTSAVRESDRLEVVAGADIDPAKRDAYKARWGVDALYDDYRTMIRQEQPDLVAICTKGVLHAEMAVGVAEENVPMIFCEKAIACSMQEADAVLDAVGSRNIPFNTGVLRRFNRTYHAARDLIASGEIGEVRTAVHYAPTNLLHGHIHSLDTVSFLLGDPKVNTVWGELFPRDLKIENNRLDKDPNGIFQITFDNGVEATSVAGGPWEFEVLGTLGSVRVLNNGGGIRMRTTTPEKRHSFVDVAVESPAAHSATQFCLEDLVGAYEDKRPALGNIQVTHHLTEVCLAIAESHRQGQRISPPLENRDLYIFHV